MGYAVHVDPDALTADARRLTAAAESLETIAGQVLTLGAGASSAAGAAQLAVALDLAAGDAARAVAQGASALAGLGTCTALAGDDYRRLEQQLTGRWGGAR